MQILAPPCVPNALLIPEKKIIRGKYQPPSSTACTVVSNIQRGVQRMHCIYTTNAHIFIRFTLWPALSETQVHFQTSTSNHPPPKKKKKKNDLDIRKVSRRRRPQLKYTCWQCCSTLSKSIFELGTSSPASERSDVLHIDWTLEGQLYFEYICIVIRTFVTCKLHILHIHKGYIWIFLSACTVYFQLCHLRIFLPYCKEKSTKNGNDPLKCVTCTFY